MLLILVTSTAISQTLTKEEKKLYDLIMEYRKENNLSVIPLSKSLTFVAKKHVEDLENNNPNQGTCNTHSWSNKGNWTPCCYTPDHSESKCMWNKPRELTSYLGNGFEIAMWQSQGAKAVDAINSWKKSSGHNVVMINLGMWKDIKWKAIGIAIYDTYAVVWFGRESDTN
ncbi:CAP domain-containing protein [Kordia antarctica]|uniref:CAP domain-containing protein n=1 Tax=Kordia antarctica TaxID=1218801 RepID=UPI00135768BF|nr:CAP domain-containing protein [Kordia antarctica]